MRAIAPYSAVDDDGEVVDASPFVLSSASLVSENITAKLREMKIYFDRNVWGNLRDFANSPERADIITRLQERIATKRFEVVLSTTVLEETLPLLGHSEARFLEEIRLIFSVVGVRQIIKSPDELLSEAVQSYAFDRRLPAMFTRTPAILRRFVANGKSRKEVFEWSKAAVDLANGFPKKLDPAFDEVKRFIEEHGIQAPGSLEEFWTRMGPSFAEWLCDRFGVLERCKDRGIDGLLKNKTVRLYTVYYAALVRAKLFGEQGTPGKVRPGESGDFFHSVQASAADVFVTEDARLRRWLEEVPIEGLLVIGLRQFIDDYI